MDEQGRERILGEDLAAKLDAVLEFVKDVPEIKTRIGRVEHRLERVEETLDVHTGILQEHSADLREIRQTLGSTVETVAELRAASHTH